MTIEERRQSLYAALMRFAPEAGSLRDRALDRVVLLALVGSSEATPFRIGRLQENIEFGPRVPKVRTELIQQSLERLIQVRKAARAELRFRHAYYLTAQGRADVDAAADSAASLFEPVLEKMLRDTAPLVERDVGVSVCRRFISECFARFGRQIAKSVTGEISPQELAETIEAPKAFSAAIRGVVLSPEAIQSLEVRCVNFLRSTAPEDEQLKFRLTQGYYVAQLFGLEAARFNPIADEAFRGSVIYVDTNVLLARQFEEEHAPRWDEVVRIARRIGVTLRITQATIDEMHRVTLGRTADLEQVVDKLPAALMERSGDELLGAFLAARKQQSDLTPSGFMRRFQDVSEVLRNAGVELDPRGAADIVRGRDVRSECAIVDAAAAESRGYGKSAEVQLHDVAHYLLVEEERSHGKQCWFLTRDKSLSLAAARLRGGGLHFCFQLVGFLQSISPFVESTQEEDPLVSLFSSALERDIEGLRAATLFDLQELKLIGEMHEDVLATPPDQLVLAFDFVKGTVLNGKLYTAADCPKVALELKKYLASNAEQREQALRKELRRREDVAAAERTRREEAERNVAEEHAKADDLRSQVRDMETKGDQRLARERELAGRETRLRLAVLALGSALALICWTMDAQIVGQVGSWILETQGRMALLRATVRVIGSFVFFGASIPAVTRLSGDLRTGGLTVTGAIALGAADVIGPHLVGLIADYLALAALIALVVLNIRRGRREVTGG
jgi:hypothetical protein